MAAALTTAAYADPLVGTLFYTTYAGSGNNVHSVDYSYDGSAIVYSNNHGIATTNGADGILFAPNGNLLVGGQGTNRISEITPTGTPVGSVDAGTGSYHLALGSDAPDATLYNIWNGGCCAAISAITLVGGGISASGAGITYTVTGGNSQDIRGIIYDPVNSTWYYGTAPDGGSGDFGTISFSGTTATLTVIATEKFAHGLTFDPYTNTVIFSSDNTISQFDPNTSSFFDFVGLVGQEFDQSAVDGKGHLFVASNSGDITFVDYSGTGNLSTASYSNTQFLANFLDDVAPLSGAGSQAIPEPGTLVLIGAALVGLGVGGRKARKA
jgi:hypothetical protein